MLLDRWIQEVPRGEGQELDLWPVSKLKICFVLYLIRIQAFCHSKIEKKLNLTVSSFCRTRISSQIRSQNRECFALVWGPYDVLLCINSKWGVSDCPFHADHLISWSENWYTYTKMFCPFSYYSSYGLAQRLKEDYNMTYLGTLKNNRKECCAVRYQLEILSFIFHDNSEKHLVFMFLPVDFKFNSFWTDPIS